MRTNEGFVQVVCAMMLIASPCVLSAEAYSPALNWNCSGCHGPGGASSGETVPSISGLHPRYLYTTMRNFKLDDRYSTIMGRIAKGYKNKELREMADFFAEHEWVSATTRPESGQVARGEELHDELCVECHDDGGRFQDKEIPRLAGQWPEYLLLQMQDYNRDGLKMPQPDKMRQRLADLAPEDLVALSAFYGQVGVDYVPNIAPGSAGAERAERTSER
jgi:sulfide dehydrogenase cytochrome subunit